MEYRQLGSSGLRVSKLCLGTMRGFTPEKSSEAEKIIGAALDSGVNFIDTADCYGRGNSEQAVGSALHSLGRRREAVLATKAGWTMGSGANDFGYSRKHLIEACDNSLRRLKTDYIDLYILHVVDPTTPLEELLYTCDILVRSGKVRYIGTSKHPVSKILTGLFTSEKYGFPRFVSEQPPYNLLDRTPENELLPACREHGVGITPFYPIATGLLSGKYQKGQAPPPGSRVAAKKKKGGEEVYNDKALEVVEHVSQLAKSKGVSVAEFSLAWVMAQPGVSSAILGARNLEYLDSALKACEITLTEEELEAIDRLVPPGRFVSNYYDLNIYLPFRRAYDLSAKEKAGAYISRRPEI